MSEGRPIIVKKVKKVAGGHHGGAWKIAYADFVTAMMAFFLLMWLLSSVNKAKLQGISEYFRTPLVEVLQGGKEGKAEETEKLVKKQLAGTADEKEMELIDQAELEQLKELKKKLEELIETNALLKQFKNQLLLDITKEGLRIQIVDDQNRPMFDLGSAVLKPYTVTILREIGKLLNEVPNRVNLAGHTDGKAYSGGQRGYSNWELSSDRANASRRELIAGGLAEDKVVRITGLADAVLFDKENPLNPINRRISIVVMNKVAVDAIYEVGAATTINSAEGVRSALAPAAEDTAKPAKVEPAAGTGKPESSPRDSATAQGSATAPAEQAPDSTPGGSH